MPIIIGPPASTPTPTPTATFTPTPTLTPTATPTPTPVTATPTPTATPVYAALGDTVWLDLNKDGIQDPNEPGIPNVMVNLLDCDGNVLRVAYTDSAGRYLFADLNAGAYRVKFVLPNGYVFSLRDQGGNDALDSDANPTNGQTICLSLPANTRDLTWDAGMYFGDASTITPTAPTVNRGTDATATATHATNRGHDPTPTATADRHGFDADATATATATPVYAALGDTVWFDLDKDGIQDPNEPGIPNVMVYLLDCDGNPLRVAYTDSAGRYLFADLNAGAYRVQFMLPNGYVFSPRDQGGNDALDSDANSSAAKRYVFRSRPTPGT